MIQKINEVKAQLQISLLAKPGNVVILKNTGVPLKQARIAVKIALLVSFRARRRSREICYGKQPIDVRLPAVRAAEILSGHVGNIVVHAIGIVVPTRAESAIVDYPIGSATLHGNNAGDLPP